MTPEEQVNWTCPNGCDAQLWEHELFAEGEVLNDNVECPPLPKPEPRDCCGRLADATTDEQRACSNDACVAWWCVCGTFTGGSAGPVGCGCEYDRGEVSTDPPARRALSLEEAAAKIDVEYGDALRTLGREEGV